MPCRGRCGADSSPISQRRVGGVPIVTIAGGLLFLFAVVSIPLLFWNGAGVIDTPVAIVLIAFYVGGPVFYYVVRAIRRRQGIDLSKAYKEIPAE